MYVQRSKAEGFRKISGVSRVIALVGPRQCGKTTFLKHWSPDFKAKYVTFDDPDVRELFNDVKSFESAYINRDGVTILDEVQYGSDPGIKLKYLADKGYDLWITSSTETLLGTSVLSHLVGRVSIQRLFPFNLKEMMLAKGHVKLTDSIEQRLIIEHIRFGGFPAIVLAEDNDIKISSLKDLLETMILKDAANTFSISDITSLNKLSRYMAINIGSSLSIDRICSDLDISFVTVKKYLDALMKSYILVKVDPYYRNKNVEIKKKSRYYFLDLGLRNSLINEFPKIPNGKEFENYVISELIKSGFSPLYWRTKGGAEVDIILEIGTKVIPIEVKTSIGKLRIGRGFRSFLEKYSPKNAYYVGFRVERKEILEKGCKVKSVTVSALLDELEQLEKELY